MLGKSRATLGGFMVRKVVAITALLALTAACGTRVKGGQAAQELRADAKASGLSEGAGTGGGEQAGTLTTDTTAAPAAVGAVASGASTTLPGPTTTLAAGGKTAGATGVTTTTAVGGKGATAQAANVSTGGATDVGVTP